MEIGHPGVAFIGLTGKDTICYYSTLGRAGALIAEPISCDFISAISISEEGLCYALPHFAIPLRTDVNLD